MKEDRKSSDLWYFFVMYLLSYEAGAFACRYFDNIMLKCFIFDTAATVMIFIFSVSLKNSSVYDAYWSLTPMVMSLCLFIGNKAFSVWQIIFLTVFTIWSVRLTLNWVSVTTGFSYEDWRYKKFRAETPKKFWPFVNFFGIHYMPTLIVFGGMLPVFEIIKNPLGIKSLPGIAITASGILLEFFSDRQMHAFLANDEKKDICRCGLWKYSRHPNYLGEITVWLGVFLTMLPYSLSKWYYGFGFAAVTVMFLIISIPLMEKRQKSRREAYGDYCKTTSMLLLMPNRKIRK